MRLLLVPYYFAPAGGPRSIRWSNIARYLSQDSHEVTVIAAGFSSDCPWMDPSLLDVVDAPGLKVHRIPVASCSPGRRENVAWMRSAIAFLGSSGISQFDAAISSAVPVVSHGVVARLRAQLKGPWIADYGDPWSQSVHRHRSAVVRWAETRYERGLLRRADAVTITTSTAVESFSPVFPHRDRIRVIPQGASSFHLDADWSRRRARPKGPLRVLYTGGFYEGVREPADLFQGLAKTSDIELTIVGHSQVDLGAAAAAAGVASRVQIRPYADIREIVRMQQETDLLLLLSWPVEEQIPGKFWEYMATSRPILYATYHPDDAIARQIREADAGYVAGPSAESIAEGLNRAKSDFDRDGEFWRPPAAGVGFDHRARQFLDLLDELRGESPR